MRSGVHFASRCLTPLETSQLSIRLARLAASSDPSSSKPKPPLMTSPLQREAEE